MDPPPFFNALPPTTTAVPSHVPLFLQLRQEGRTLAFQDDMLGGGGGNHREWRLSTQQQIRSSSRAATTDLDLCTGNGQFLLTGSQMGNVSIYDLWGKKGCFTTSLPETITYQPIQQASAGLSTIVAVQWYPVDSGIFLTASAAGTVCLWDTAAMVPVMRSKPFQYMEDSCSSSSSSSSSYALRCLHVSPHNLLAAAGSNGSAVVKLIDLQSGAASHSLMPPQKGYSSGVTAVRWSPIHSHILASCAGQAAIWDIRKTRQPLAVLDADVRSADDFLSTAFDADYSHWVPKTKHGQQKAASTRRSITTTTTATNLAFDDVGQHLVTVCGKSRDVAVWDLRYAGAPVRRLQTFVDSTGGKAADLGDAQPLLLTVATTTTTTFKRCRTDRMIWIAKGNNFHGYSMFGATDTNNDGGGGGKPVAILRGHLGRVQAAAVVAVSTWPSMFYPMMLTAAADGLILPWAKQRRRLHSNSVPQGSDGRTRKRPATHDVDSW